MQYRWELEYQEGFKPSCRELQRALGWLFCLPVFLCKDKEPGHHLRGREQSSKDTHTYGFIRADFPASRSASNKLPVFLYHPA